MELKCRLYKIRLTEYLQDNKKQFAEQMGFDYRAYCRWEEGTIPKPVTMFEIAKKLNKKVDDIWYLEGAE